MKKALCCLILVLSACLFSVAQTKPTKQETIDWITAKLRDYNIVSPNSLSKYEYQITDDGSFTQSVYTITNSGIIARRTIIISPQSVYKAENNDGKNGLTVFFKTPVELVTYHYSNDSETTSKVSSANLALDWNKEPNLRERMFKALSALAEYNNPKVKEVY